MSTFKAMRKFIFTVNCCMGITKYVVIGRSSEIALNELNHYFYHDSKFEILAIDKLGKYNNQVDKK